MNENENTGTVESSGQLDTQDNADNEVTTETVVYTDQLKAIQDYQSLQIGLECVMIGVLLIFAVFNVLKRYI